MESQQNHLGFKKCFLAQPTKKETTKDELLQKEKKLKHPMEPEFARPLCNDQETVVFQILLELEDFENDCFDELAKFSNMDDTPIGRSHFLHILQVVAAKRYHSVVIVDHASYEGQDANQGIVDLKVEVQSWQS